MLSIKDWDDRYLKRVERSRNAAGSQTLGRSSSTPVHVESTSLLSSAEEPGTPRVPSSSSAKDLENVNLVLDHDDDIDPPDISPTDAATVALDIVDESGINNVADIAEGLTQFQNQPDDDDLDPVDLEDFDWKKLWSYDKAKFFKRILRRAPYYVFPVALWLPKYHWKRDLLSDIVAGIGVGCMAVPQALAYAIVAGVPPVMGLYSAFFPLIIFAAMTTSKHMHFGPDALASLLVGLTMLGPEYTNESKAELASVFACICGLTLLMLGIFRFGFLDNILSRPLLSGFVNAVAVIIVVNQLEPFLGLPNSHAEQAWQKIAAVISHIRDTNLWTLLFGSICLAVLIVLRVLKWKFNESKWLKYIIDPFIVVVIGISCSYALNLSKLGITILGSFPGSIPLPEVPKIGNLGLIQIYAVDSVIICIIGFVESIVAAKIYATKYNYTISPNRELVAMGAANLIGSFFHTYPAFGTLTRSAVADFLGSKSQLYSFVSALVVLVTILALGPVVYFLPRVTMSAIIIVAAYSLIELHDLLFLWRIKAWKEIALLISTFAITFVLGVDLGIFIGIGISLMLVIAHTSVPHITILGKDITGVWTDVSRDGSAEMDPTTLVVRIEEALYFANIEQIKDMFKRIELFGSHRAHPTARAKIGGSLENIVVHCKNITEIDASAVETLFEMVSDYQKRDVFLCFVKPRPEIRDMFLRAGILGSLGGDRVFLSVDDAIKYIKAKKKETGKPK